MTEPRLEERLDEVLGQYLDEEADGRAPPPSAFIAEHPSLAPRLQAFFANRRLVEGLVSPLRQKDTGLGETGPEQPSGAVSQYPPVPGYEVLGELGQGGMGVVYKARQSGLDRLVALKVIRGCEPGAAEVTARFHREARAVAQLQHPHIVVIHDLGEWRGAASAAPMPYLSLEYLAGGNLARKWGRTPQPPGEAAELVAVLARTMQHVHDIGILHRDLKPGNVLLAGDGTPKICDFGLARLREAPGEGELTGAGQVLGTPNYMAPEQATGRNDLVGPATDVWALGAILYEGLTGQPPFLSPTRDALLYKICHEEPRRPEELQPHVPRDLEAICLKCLHKAPQRRYSSAAALAEDLQRFRNGQPVHARPIRLWRRMWRWGKREPMAVALVAAVLLVLLGGIGVAWLFGLNAQQQEKTAWESAARLREEKRLSDRLIYAFQINQAQRAWELGSVGRTLELLDRHRPERPEEADVRGWEWHHLQRQCHGDLLSLQGHIGEVTAVAYSHDGTVLASAGVDGTVRTWDARTGKSLAVLRGHRDRVNSLAFAPGGTQLVTGSDDRTVRIWDLATGKQRYAGAGHILPVTSVAWRPDGKQLASASRDGTVQIRDDGDGRTLRVLQGHRSIVNKVVYSPDGTRLASAGDDKTVRLWDADTGATKVVIRGHEGEVLSLAFSPDGKSLASGAQLTLRLWQSETGKEAAVWKEKHRVFNTLLFDPSGRSLASAGEDRTIRLWDVATGKSSRVIRGHVGSVRDLSFSPDGKRLASAGADHVIKVWQTELRSDALVLRDHELAVFTLAFSADGKRLATGSYDHLVRIFDAHTGRLRQALGEQIIHRRPGKDDDPERIQRIEAKSGHSGMVSCLTFSPDGTQLASGSTDQTARLWDVERGKELLTLRHAGPVTGVAFSPPRPDGGKRLATASWDHTARLWDLASGKELFLLRGHTQNLTALAWSRDGTTIATVARDHTIRLWDAETGREVRQLKSSAEWVRGLAFSPDSRRLAAAGDDELVRVWDVSTGEEVVALHGHVAAVQMVAFSPDGRRMATAGGMPDESVKVWDAQTGQELLTLPEARWTVAFSPDGKRLATGGSNRTALVWDSEPLDASPRRTARFTPPAPLPPRTPQPAGSLEVLGYLTAQSLPRKDGKDGEVLTLPANREFVVVVLSVPASELIVTEGEYQALLREEAAGPAPRPLAPRLCIINHDFKRFRLVLRGQEGRGQLIGDYPDCLVKHGEGFSRRTYKVTRSNAYEADERVGIAVGWVVPAGTVNGPLQVRLDGGEVVAVPEVRLQWLGN